MSKQRWMKWITQDAASQTLTMPWERAAKVAAKTAEASAPPKAKSA